MQLNYSLSGHDLFLLVSFYGFLSKIKLFIRKAYGFKNIQNLLDMILLGCSNIKIPLPNRGGLGLKVA